MQVSDKLTKPLTEAKYLNADNVSRYRCIMRIFFEHYEKLKYWLYQEDLEEMQEEADVMAFEEHAFMREELERNLEEAYKFDLHQEQFDHTKAKINEGTEILAQTDRLERQKDDLLKEREKKIRELDSLQRKIAELEAVFVQTKNEWKEALYGWNGKNKQLILEKELLRELSDFAESYQETSDFAGVRQKISEVDQKKCGY